MKHKYEIRGMHCSDCATKVTSALKSVAHVIDLKVSVNPPEAVIKMDQHISTEILSEAVGAAGKYSLKEINSSSHAKTSSADEKQSLKPLFVIIAYIVGGVALNSQLTNDFTEHTLMRNFMGGFFVLFSLFKMIDLSGFADGYQSYDVIAKRSRLYALTYPFIELGLGTLYFSDLVPVVTNSLTIALMTVGAVGVGKALLEKRSIQCACLGTVLKLPMTKVTFAEDALMGFMAFLMLQSEFVKSFFFN